MTNRALLDVEERFWSYVQKTPTHYLWKGSESRGYGVFGLGTREQGTVGAHVFAYMTYVDNVPLGFDVHYLCHVTLCVRPKHLEAISRRDHLLLGNSPVGINARKTHCIHGHPFDDENTLLVKSGTERRCRECQRAYMERWRVHQRQ